MTSTTPIKIRSVAVADFDAWLALWRGYQAFYKTDIPMDTTLRTWAPVSYTHLTLPTILRV